MCEHFLFVEVSVLPVWSYVTFHLSMIWKKGNSFASDFIGHCSLLSLDIT
jgi:hypothetical protein